MSRVFVVNEPTEPDPDTGLRRRKLDLTPATAFGDLVFLTPPGNPPLDPEAILPNMREKLRDFCEDDYLLLVGHPTLIAWASILAARANGGRIQTLIWRGRSSSYYGLSAAVTGEALYDG